MNSQSWYIMIGLAILDTVTTSMNIHHSGINGELNPFVKYLIMQYGMFSLWIGQALILIMIYALLKYGEKKYSGNTKEFQTTINVLNIARFLVVMNNLLGLV